MFFAVLGIAGCGTKNSIFTPAQNSGQLVVAMGDALSDRVIAFALTVNAMTPTGGINLAVTSTPTPMEFVRNDGTPSAAGHCTTCPGNL